MITLQLLGIEIKYYKILTSVYGPVVGGPLVVRKWQKIVHERHDKHLYQINVSWLMLEFILYQRRQLRGTHFDNQLNKVLTIVLSNLTRMIYKWCVIEI